MARRIDPLKKAAGAIIRALDKLPPEQRSAALSMVQFTLERENGAAKPARARKSREATPPADSPQRDLVG